MKRYIKHLIILVITITLVIPSAFAQVDITRSFYVLRNDSAANAFVEGGEWLIEFSSKDTLGNEYDYPVAMNFRGAYYPDTTLIPMQAVDSVQFVQPSTIMKSDVFELTKEHYKYIIDTDLKSTVRFRIDCIAKIDLPRVGQKVISYIYEDPLPLGFLGQVESIKVVYDEGSILMTYKPIRLSDVYDRLYVSSVVGQESEDADTVPEVVSRSSKLRPLDYDYNDQIDIIADIPLPLPDVGIIFNSSKLKLESSTSPKTDKTPAKIYAVDNAIGVKIFEAIIIDAENKVDYTEMVVEASLESTLGAAVEFTDAAPDIIFDGKNPLSHRWSFAPKIKNALYLNKGEEINVAGGIIKVFPSMPAAFCRIDWGILLDLAIDLQFKVEDSFRVTTKFGYKDTGNLTPVFEVLCPDKLEFNQLNFDFSLVGGLKMKTGPYFMAKIGIPSVVDLSVEFCDGLNLDGRFNTNFIGLEKEDDIDAKKSTLSDLEAQLKAINKENYFKFQSGIMLDGNVSVLKGYVLNESWVNWLRKIDAIDNILNFLLATWVDYEGIPTYEFSNNSNSNAFGGIFTSKKRYMLNNHKLGLLFKDRYLDAEDPSYVDIRYLKDMTDGKPVHYGFTIFKDDNKHLKGKTLDVYSLIKINSAGEYGKFCSTGKIAEIELPYDSKVSQMIGDDYTYVAVDIEVDPDAAEDEDYTQSGILVWKDGKKEETGIRLVGNENYAVNAQIQFDRKMFSDYRNDIKSNMEYCVKPWVYDAKRDRYVYGEQSKFQLNSLVGPKTMPATDITYNSAYLKGTVHEEFFNYIDGDFEIIFSYWIPGETAETVLKYKSSDYPDIATTLACEALVIGLRPNTEYEYRVGLNYSSDGFFGGEPLKFKTKNVISNLKHEAGTDFAVLYADVVTDFIADELKEVSFEIVESDKDFKKAIGKIADEGDFTINEDGTTTIDVIFYDLKPSIKYKYRMVFETESGYKVYSDVGYLTTEATLLKAITGSATVSGNTARIKGTLSDDLYELLKSQEVKNVYFNYMEKSSDMAIGVNVEFSGTSYSTKLTGLNYETTYDYQFYAEDIDGNKYEGEWMTFTTDDKPEGYAEECYTLSATVNDADVTMIGGIPASTLKAVENGTLKNVQYGFEVSESSSGLTGTKPTFATSEIDVETGLFTIVKVLQPNTTYYIRAMVFINDRWIAAPEVVTVKTADFDPNLKPPAIEKEQ